MKHSIDLLFLFVMLIVWGIVFYALAGPGIRGLIKRKRDTAKYGSLRRLAQNLTTEYLSIYEKFFFFVHYLNVAGELKSMTLSDFLSLNLPEDEKPAVWILRIVKTDSPAIQAGDSIHLVWRDQKTASEAKWQFRISKRVPTISSINNTFVLSLADKMGFPTAVVVGAHDGYEVLFKDVLELVTNYKSVNDLWIALLQEKIPPILLATKGQMGKSPLLEGVRKFIEEGPSSLKYTNKPVIA